MLLFSRVVTAASLWVHLLAINLYAARTAYLQGATALLSGLAAWPAVNGICRALQIFLLFAAQCEAASGAATDQLVGKQQMFLAHAGLARGVPVRHTVLLCALLGPVGLLSHFATCALWSALAASEPVAAAQGLVPLSEPA